MKSSKNQSIRVFLFLILALVLAACSGSTGGTVPSDWETFEGEGFSFQLPTSFQGGSDEQDFAEIAQMFREAGQENLAQSLEANAGFILLYAADTEINNDNETYTNVNVIREQNPALNDYTIQEYVDVSLTQLQAVQGITVVDQRAVTIAGFDAYLLVEEYDLALLLGATGVSKADQYLLKSGDSVWVLTYTTDISEYDARHADFETSAESFAVK